MKYCLEAPITKLFKLEIVTWSELNMVKIYWNTTPAAVMLKIPNTQVRPRRGNSTTHAFNPCLKWSDIEGKSEHSIWDKTRKWQHGADTHSLEVRGVFRRVHSRHLIHHPTKDGGVYLMKLTSTCTNDFYNRRRTNWRALIFIILLKWSLFQVLSP